MSASAWAALYALNFVPAPLEALYAGDPEGAMAFIRLQSRLMRGAQR